jgi:DNA-binding response OmpR family regulator
MHSPSYEAHGNVLVVEDDEECGRLLQEILSQAGFGVRIVTTRDAAVAAFSHNLYDHIILDVAMRGMTIDRFLRDFVPLKEKVVLISAVVDPQREARRLGIEHWMRKPFDPHALVALLLDLSAQHAHW